MKSISGETQDCPWFGIYVKNEWKKPMKLNLVSGGQLGLGKLCQRCENMDKCIDQRCMDYKILGVYG
jgi:hypothetical protein